MAYSYLIDISRWQGNVDHAQVVRAGISGCVIKASEGLRADTTTATASYFRAHAPVAKRTYPLYGAYHYLTPGGNAAGQVGWFLEQIRAGYGELDGCIVQLDAEDHGGGKPVLTVADVRSWKNDWDSATGSYPVLLYAPKWYWSQVDGYAALADLGFAGWWPSAYVTGSGNHVALAAKITSAWGSFAGLTPAIAQYSQQGRIAGVAGDVDLNEVRMPLALFRALTTRQQQEDELSAEYEERTRKQLDALYDAIVGGQGGAWKTGALPVYLATLAAESKARDGALLTAVQTMAGGRGFDQAAVDRIVAAIEGNREAARQAAADAATTAFARWMDAAARPSYPPA